MVHLGAINGLLSCFTYHNALGNKAETRLRRMPGLSAVGNPPLGGPREVVLKGLRRVVHLILHGFSRFFFFFYPFVFSLLSP